MLAAEAVLNEIREGATPDPAATRRRFQNMDIDVRNHVKQGPVLIDLTALNSDTLIAPRETGRMLFYIKSHDSLRLYSDFDDFAIDLSNSLDLSTTARSMHARGLYDADTNIFMAYKIGVHLLEP